MVHLGRFILALFVGGGLVAGLVSILFGAQGVWPMPAPVTTFLLCSGSMIACWPLWKPYAGDTTFRRHVLSVLAGTGAVALVMLLVGDERGLTVMLYLGLAMLSVGLVLYVWRDWKHGQ